MISEQKTEVLSQVIRIGCVMTGLLIWASAEAIDCEKAVKPVENAICADDELMRLDAELNEVYGAALRYVTDSMELKRDAVDWLKRRDQSNPKRLDEIGELYRERIATLKNIADNGLPSVQDNGSFVSLGGGAYLKGDGPSFTFVSPSSDQPQKVYWGYEPEIVDIKGIHKNIKWILIEDSKLERGITRHWYSVISVSGTDSALTVKGQGLEAASSVSAGMAACGSADVPTAESIHGYSFKNAARDKFDGIVFEIVERNCLAKRGKRMPVKKRVAWIWDGSSFSRSELK